MCIYRPAISGLYEGSASGDGRITVYGKVFGTYLWDTTLPRYQVSPKKMSQKDYVLCKVHNKLELTTLATPDLRVLTHSTRWSSEGAMER